jgi:hypothetical protein
MITGMGVFVECRYGSHMGIDVATLVGKIDLSKNQSMRI